MGGGGSYLKTRVAAKIINFAFCEMFLELKFCKNLCFYFCEILNSFDKMSCLAKFQNYCFAATLIINKLSFVQAYTCPGPVPGLPQRYPTQPVQIQPSYHPYQVGRFRQVHKYQSTKKYFSLSLLVFPTGNTPG